VFEALHGDEDIEFDNYLTVDNEDDDYDDDY